LLNFWINQVFSKFSLVCQQFNEKSRVFFRLFQVLNEVFSNF